MNPTPRPYFHCMPVSALCRLPVPSTVPLTLLLYYLTHLLVIVLQNSIIYVFIHSVVLSNVVIYVIGGANTGLARDLPPACFALVLMLLSIDRHCRSAAYELFTTIYFY